MVVVKKNFQSRGRSVSGMTIKFHLSITADGYIVEDCYLVAMLPISLKPMI